MAEATPRTPWRLKVHNMEACNCSNGCGCQFNGFPDYGKCEAIVGYEVIDYFYAPRSIGLANSIAKKLLIPPRVLFFSIRKDLAVRILGGYSLLVLAQ